MDNMIFMSIMYILLIILLVVIISVCIKIILVIDEVNEKIDDVNEKVHSYDSIFNFIDDMCLKVLNLNDVFIEKVSTFLHLDRKGR